MPMRPCLLPVVPTPNKPAPVCHAREPFSKRRRQRRAQRFSSLRLCKALPRLPLGTTAHLSAWAAASRPVAAAWTSCRQRTTGCLTYVCMAWLQCLLCPCLHPARSIAGALPPRGPLHSTAQLVWGTLRVKSSDSQQTCRVALSCLCQLRCRLVGAMPRPRRPCPPARGTKRAPAVAREYVLLHHP